MFLRRILSSDMGCNTTTTPGTCTEVTNEVGLSLMALVQGVTLILAIATNGIVCIVFYKKPHLLSVNNTFVLNLSCCQLVMAVVIPFSLASIFSSTWTLNNALCCVQGYLLTTCIIATQFSLMVISIDRNYAIINSLRYPYIFTQRRANLLILMTWMFGLLFAIPPLIGWGKYEYIPSQFLCGLHWSSSTSFLTTFSIVCFVIPLLIQSWCYLSIFKAALGHSKRSSRVFPSMPSTIQRDPNSDCSDCSEISQAYPPQYRNVECKAVRTILFIACAYSICWVPYFVSSFYTIQEYDVNRTFNSFAISAVLMSTVINPIIYAFFNRVTRYEINKFFCDTVKIMNSHTTTGNESDDYFTTSTTTYLSSKQSINILATKQKTVSTTTPKSTKMNTIEEESTENKSMKSEHVCTDVLQLNVSDLENNVKSVFNASSSNSDYDSMGRKRSSRARSEFLTGSNTFYAKSVNDSGSFLFFENNPDLISNKHHHHHRHHYHNSHSRKRANSHFPGSSTSRSPQLLHENAISMMTLKSANTEMSNNISSSVCSSSIENFQNSSCDFMKILSDEPRQRSDTTSSDTKVVLNRKKDIRRELEKDPISQESPTLQHTPDRLAKLLSRKICERNIHLKIKFNTAQRTANDESITTSSELEKETQGKRHRWL